MRIKLNSLEDTKDLAIKIADLVKDKAGTVIFLIGDLGTGKTTFAKFFAERFNASAKSPTFGLVNIYEGSKTIYHLDLYRLNDYYEALNIGIEEILDNSSIKLIEWPEILEGEEHDAEIVFSREGEDRYIDISGKLFEGRELC